MGESEEYLYDADDGTITVLFRELDNISLIHKYLNLTPVLDDNDNLIWECESDISQAQLPSLCRY